MQKLVSICLSDSARRHGVVEEHLADYLAEGWHVVSLCAAGSSPGAVWLAAVLQKGTAGQGQALAAAQPGAAFGQGFPLIEYPQSAAGIPVEPSDVPVGPDTHLEAGSRVLAYWGGRWWRAVVVALEPGDRVRIHYPGWDAKWDTSVPREELQVDLNAGEE